MSLDVLTAFFGWLSVVHIVLFSFSAVLFMTSRNFVARLHGRLFGLKPETIVEALYGWLALYKIMIFTTAIGPWLVLKLM